ncbi:flagellin [Edaphobacter albus]|uniref:flagellin n=1 Tax=Edaphobacter sp. 4G125 TaxID=2763071 RepID=UPI0016478A7A|nr:flagellin [Edaphobacter sp. 4G125]QNI38279.1 flagellin [Edaphobacter sp. 4G125]
MSLGVLNNISAIYAQNNLNLTQQNLQNTLTQLSSGSRINSGADDAAGLALADGLHANVAALTQSAQNASAGVGMLQTADGALAQVTNLLTRAITLATEAANGTLNSSQVGSANQEYQNILTEIDNIGKTTNYNGNNVFSATAVNIFVSDGTSSGASTFAQTVGTLAKSSVGTTSGGGGADLTTNATLSATTASSILTTLTTAVQDVAYQRGTLGANINQLNAAANVANSQSVNLASAENNIRATNYGQATSDMAKYKILSETGIAALSQANAVQQDVLKLLQ